jgi:parallel beta-helix repeat protein
MNRQSAFLMILMLFLLNIASVTLGVQRVEASGTIYIRADGSIDPPTPSIYTADNITYTFADNINDSIVVERSNIIIDGAGYTVEGTGVEYGFSLYGIANVTIKSTNIKSFGVGIRLEQSSGNSISENNVANNMVGVRLYYSSNNSIFGNNITNNNYGIDLGFSYNNGIVGNVFAGCGLLVSHSYGNRVEGNTVNGKPLVYLEGVSDFTVEDAGQVILVNCNNIRVENLNLSNATQGVQLWTTSNTVIADNNIANNEYCGIELQYSSNNNSISGNNITANNGTGIYLSSSFNNNISGNNITNNGAGIFFAGYSNNNSVSGNNITANNEVGIGLYWSSKYNSISGNNITNNSKGIRLYSSSNNSIFHNNFVNNINQVFSFDSVSVWDDGYPSGGNCWSDYGGYDGNNDGIGDSNYTIDANNDDRYPLMGMFTEFNATSEHHVQTICNSTISDFQFNGTAISFNVSGENDTAGFCRVCIPTAMMSTTYNVFVNGTEVSYNLLPCSNESFSYLYFNYTHSTQEVIIIPEFPSFLILPLFMIATLLAVTAYRRKHPQNE